MTINITDLDWLKRTQKLESPRSPELRDLDHAIRIEDEAKAKVALKKWMDSQVRKNGSKWDQIIAKQNKDAANALYVLYRGLFGDTNLFRTS